MMRLTLGAFVLSIRKDRTVHGICSNCHWWIEHVSTPSGATGHCHRLAPISGPNGQTFFPRMRHNQSCGQWATRRGEGAR